MSARTRLHEIFRLSQNPGYLRLAAFARQNLDRYVTASGWLAEAQKDGGIRGLSCRNWTDQSSSDT